MFILKKEKIFAPRYIMCAPGAMVRLSTVGGVGCAPLHKMSLPNEWMEREGN